MLLFIRDLSICGFENWMVDRGVLDKYSTEIEGQLYFKGIELDCWINIIMNEIKN